MKNVFFAIPTANEARRADTFAKWESRGYATAAFVDGLTYSFPFSRIADIYIHNNIYPGYSQAVNRLCKAILDSRPEVNWIVTGGDDINPDPNHDPEEIARECTEYFGGTFGVMQPTGDKWGHPDANGTFDCERVCLSPWLGREFIQRWNGGIGPFWPEYLHFFCDEELHETAKMHDLLWHRPDLTQYHAHWGRTGEDKDTTRPYLKKAHANWAAARELCYSRKAAKFPGHEPL